MIKVISFDLDDTLSDSQFDELIWRAEIPKAYAREKNIPFDEAFRIVTTEYNALWGKIKGNWRDASFWLKHFGLETTWEDLLVAVEHEIKHYPDVNAMLSELAKDFKLIIVSNAERKFIDAKLRCNHLEQFFVKTYSAASDFDKIKKDEEVFRKALADFKIGPDEIVHIGDDGVYDVDVPRALKIKAFLLHRERKKKADFHNLYEFREWLLKVTPKKSKRDI